MRLFRFKKFREPRILKQIFEKNVTESNFNTRIINKYILERKLEKFNKHARDETFKDLIYFSNKLLKQKKAFSFNAKDSLILLEGKILVREAIKSECVNIERIFLSNENILNDSKFNHLQILKSQKIHKISNDLMESISNVKTNQGILAFAKMSQNKIPKRYSFSVILDRVSDPGNMGTIIRTAASIGCNQILVTRESVNPWSPKVLRAAMGGHFYINIKHDLKIEDLKNLISKNSKLIIGDSKDSSETINYCNMETHLNKCDNKEDLFLAIGHEAHGISDGIYNLKNEGVKILKTKIPILMESLNCSIAFAVLGFEIRRILNNK